MPKKATPMPKKATPKPTKQNTKMPAIHGKTKKNIVKINGFDMMAIKLQNQSTSKINLNPYQMKDQFNTYKDKYKKISSKN
ncbi:hypothetical protein VP01_2577g1 [Puccinia sorghi]|uniref:Uncharacterized protein n=1 Tax=Puccinia sorghi TaxID=27349 RepID=A0A0L6V4Z4_9BASI|nr:hypothetical protein VP01_2577g1 [Puccinia sorghi]